MSVGKTNMPVTAGNRYNIGGGHLGFLIHIKNTCYSLNPDVLF
jgi:hypothetical protein